ncbi:MAG TPA: squalene/phytoene synthase family protein, partial [Polyangiaceae bacterium]
AHRVAGVVGLMMCHVLGARGPSALRHAAHLGIAMQLTNICRDVVEDWERGRMYLPDDILSETGAPKLAAHLGGPLERSHGPALAGALRKLLALADQYYCSGDAGLPALPSRAAFAVRAARLVYADIGRNLARRDFDVFAGRAVVSQTRKLTLVARAAVEELGARCWAFLRRAKPRGLADVRPLPRPADPEGSFLLDD